MPQDQKDALLAQVQAAESVALSMALDSAYDAGVVSVPANPGTFTQVDVDNAHSAGVQEGHDAEKLTAKSAADNAIDQT